MIRAAFLGSSTVAGKDLPDPANRFSTLVSRILGWDEVNFGISDTCVTGRDIDGGIVATESGVARAAGVLDSDPDIVIVLYGAEDFSKSVLAGEQRLEMGVDSVASVPAITDERRSGRSAGVEHTSSVRLPGRMSPLIIQSLTRGAQALPGTFAGDYSALLAGLLQTLSPEQIFVMTPPYNPSADEPNATGLRLSDYCDAIWRIAGAYDIKVLDAFAQSTVQPAVFADLSDNGRDLNAAGHQRLAAFLIDELHSWTA